MMIERQVRDQEPHPLLSPCNAKRSVKKLLLIIQERASTNSSGKKITITKNCGLKVISNKLRNPKRPRKNTLGAYNRNFTRKYFLDDLRNNNDNVCKVFF